jgi:NSS family neurotransmitter:Na+ symporter
MCCELALGKNYSLPYPQTLKKLNKRAYFLGTAACANCAFTALYYSGITAYLLITSANIFPIVMSGQNAADFLFEGLLKTGENFTLSYIVLASLAAVWLVFFILLKDKGSISKSAKFTVPFALLLFALMAVRGVLYSNSGRALASLFCFKGSLIDIKLWSEALAQSLLSLSLAAGVMPTFAQNVGKNFNVPKNAAIILFANFFGCILSSVAFFCAVYGCNLTYLVGDGGIFAAFYVYPIALASLFPSKTFSAVFALLFFIAFFLTAMQSSLSLLSPILSAVTLSSKRTAAIICVVGFFLSLVFATSLGKSALTFCDGIACSVNSMLLASLECALFGRSYANKRGVIAVILRLISLMFVALFVIGIIKMASSFSRPLTAICALLVFCCVFGCGFIIKIIKLLKNYISPLTERVKSVKIKLWKRYKL